MTSKDKSFNDDVSIKIIINSLIVMMNKNIQKDDDMYEEFCELETNLKKENIPKDPTNKLLKLFSDDELYTDIILHIRKELNFIIQTDKECIDNLNKIKLSLIDPENTKKIDRIIVFLSHKDSILNSSIIRDTISLCKITYSIKNSQTSDLWEDCIDYIDSLMDDD